MFVELLQISLILGAKEVKLQLLLQKRMDNPRNIVKKKKIAPLNNSLFISLNLMLCEIRVTEQQIQINSCKPSNFVLKVVGYKRTNFYSMVRQAIFCCFLH